jgi:hypothetical protein
VTASGAQLDELKAMRRAQWRQRLAVLAAAAGLVALLGVLPIPFGMGPFAWRQCAYDRVDFHLANTSGATLTLEVNGQDPVQCPDGRLTAETFLAGQTRYRILREDGTVYDEGERFTDDQAIFYNAGEGCFAIMDLAGMYDPERRDIDQIAVIGQITPEDRLALIPPGIFVKPRGLPPDNVQAGTAVVWIDDVACELLDEAEREVLLTQELIRIQTRRERREALRRQRQEAAE